MSMNSSFVEQVNEPGALPPEELARVQEMYQDLLLQTDASRIAGRIARTYAEALLAVAEARGEGDAVAEQFRSLSDDIFRSSPDVEAFLQNPAFNKQRKDEVLAKLFDGRATPLFLDFLRVLNHKDRLGLVRMIGVAYQALRDARANRVQVLVESAAPLAPDQLEAVRSTLAGTLNKTPVLVPRVNPDLIGGLVVHVGDKVFDTSVRTRLLNFRNQLLARGSYEIQSRRDRFSS